MLKTYEHRVNYHIVDVKVSQLPAQMAARLEKTCIYSDSPQTPSPSQAYCTKQTDQMEAGPQTVR